MLNKNSKNKIFVNKKVAPRGIEPLLSDCPPEVDPPLVKN